MSQDQSNEEVLIRNKKVITVTYVQKNKLAPAFGLAFPKYCSVLVREDLHPRVKKFVLEHELYHVIDTHTWGGWAGREIRANLIPGIKDPFGFLYTIWETVKSKERRNFYLERLRRGY